MTAPISLIDTSPEAWAYVTSTSVLGPGAIAASIEKAFAQLTEAVARAGVRTSGPPRAHYNYRDGAQVSFELGFPIVPKDMPAARRAGLGVGQTLSGKALTMVHEGPYADLSGAYRTLERDLRSRGLSGGGDTWEVYLNDPDDTPPAKLQTQIFWPIGEQPAS